MPYQAQGQAQALQQWSHGMMWDEVKSHEILFNISLVLMFGRPASGRSGHDDFATARYSVHGKERRLRRYRIRASRTLAWA